MRKADAHIFSGMQRDMSVSKQKAEFLWDARNIRLTAREGDTMLSVTNERGTKAAEVHSTANEKIKGEYTGHCVIGNYLVVFTHSTKGDYIYRLLKEEDGSFTMKCLTGEVEGISQPLDLGLNPNYPLQTLGVYENAFIQKVYWTDGINQPRVINIVKDLLDSNVKYNKYSFDFVPVMSLKDSLHIRRIADSSGSFGAGLIQYFVSYYNKYGQESNISCASALIPTSYNDRAGSPEEKVGNSFVVTIENPDTTFEYARVYSIFRSSINATPACRRVADISMENLKAGKRTMIVNPVIFTYTVRSDNEFQVKKDAESEWIPYTDKEIQGLAEITRTPLGGAANYYVFRKADYPELVLKVKINNQDKYVTWGNSDTIYLSVYQRVETSTGGVEVYGIIGSRGGKLNDFIIADYIGTSTSETETTKLTFTDNGTIGEDFDVKNLLYIGGESITAGTIEQKDGTLFLGNIKVTRPVIQDTLKVQLKDKAKGMTTEEDWSSVRYAYLPATIRSESYVWSNSLLAKTHLAGKRFPGGTYIDTDENTSTAGFKFREHYRLGVQFQYKTGKWSEPVFLADKTETERPKNENIYAGGVSASKLDIPGFSVMLDKDSCKSLIDSGYVRARALMVIPSNQDRLIAAQGILNPTVYSIGFRETHSPDIQSSWFFRPWPSRYKRDTENYSNQYVYEGASIEYRHNYSLYGFNNRGAEIQGVPFCYDDKGTFRTWGGKPRNGGLLPTTGQKTLAWTNDHNNKDDSGAVQVSADQCSNIFCVDQQNVTMHSPEFEFDGSIANLDMSTIKARKVGTTGFSCNVGTIDIRTSTPAIKSTAAGFVKKTMRISTQSIADKRLCAGLFYEDNLVDDYKDGNTIKYNSWDKSKIDYGFMVYPWHRTGSLNNDCVRSSDGGTRTAVLERKIISNLKFSSTSTFDREAEELAFASSGNADSAGNAVQYFNSDQQVVVRPAGLNYYGNADELLLPPVSYGFIFNNGGNLVLNGDVTITFSGIMSKVKLYPKFDDSQNTFWFSCDTGLILLKEGGTGTDPLLAYGVGTNSWKIGDYSGSLQTTRETIRMKYKSTPHIVMSLKEPLTGDINTRNTPFLHLAELYRKENKETDFGGETEEALKSNLWIPAGDAIPLSEEGTRVDYDYGDTWFQRYDCLKTYPFTEEDTNSIVEIGSFMVETHINIDGRYDRNRGQDDNINMRPRNFNLINNVYSQLDNFFNYRIMDSDYYSLNEFPSMITWTTQKSNASEIDPWTTITLASTLDIDGTKGKVTAIAASGNQLYSFQDKGIAQILFNSRVSIPTSDNLPIEISNSYKVDGERYISTSTGCSDKFAIAKASGGIYFIDDIGKALYVLTGDQITNISDTRGFNYWFSQQDTENSWRSGVWTKDSFKYNKGISLYYDKGKKDLYVMTPEETLCYSEMLGQFVSFMDYQGGVLTNVGSEFYALTSNDSQNVDLWQMFKGDYNSFYYDRHRTELTFVSNAESMQDKIFTNLDIRADFYEDGELQHRQFFDTIRAWNEYQDTGETKLVFKKNLPSNTKKKFRIWRCDIPRVLNKETEKRTLDRIRNTWCKIRLTMNDDAKRKMEMHDVGVIYYI